MTEERTALYDTILTSLATIQETVGRDMHAIRDARTAVETLKILDSRVIPNSDTSVGISCPTTGTEPPAVEEKPSGRRHK